MAISAQLEQVDHPPLNLQVNSHSIVDTFLGEQRYYTVAYLNHELLLLLLRSVEQAPGQMQYLMTGFEVTDAPASPSLKRNSKVLSFFNDSEDVLVLEGIGDGAHPNNTDESRSHFKNFSGNLYSLLF